MIMVVESGKADTKYKIGEIKGKFSTKYSKNDKVIEGVDKNSYNMVYEGVLYKIGDNATEMDFEISKNKDIHKLCILNAICQFKPRGMTEIQLVTGTPVNMFFTDEREKIVKNLKGNYNILCLKDGVNKIEQFKITKVLVVPETMGYIYNNYVECKDKLVRVIDLGGLNVNGLIYLKGVPMRETGFTTNDGINILITSIMNDLNKDGFNYQRYEVEYLLKSGDRNEREEGIITQKVAHYLEQISGKMRANNWNIDTGEIVFTGGGALLLETQIKETFKGAIISKNCVYDNVEGFEIIGGALL